MDPHSVIEVDISHEIESQVAVGALLPRQKRRERDIEEGRTEDFIVDDLELEFADGPPLFLEPEVDGDEARHPPDLAQGARRPVLAEGADQCLGLGKLERALQAGDDRDDARLGHGVIDGAEVVEGMAESQNPVPVHVGHGPDRRSVGVAADKLDADRVAFVEGEIRAQNHVPGLGGYPAQDRDETHSLQEGPGPFDGAAGKSAEDQGQAEPPGHPAARLEGDLGRDQVLVPLEQVFQAQPVRQGQTERRNGPRRRPIDDRQHLIDGRNPRDGLLGVRKAVGDRADDLAVDEDGTAAHALDDPGLVHGLAPEPGQDQAPLRLDVGEDAQDLDVRFLDRVAGEDAPGFAGHAGLDIVQGHR